MSAIIIDATASSTATRHEAFLVRSSPLSAPGNGTPLGESDRASALSPAAQDQAAAFRRCWIIYMLTHRGSGLRYVGLTCRPLEDRLRAHTYQAGRIRTVRSGGLMEALRRAFENGQSLTEAFSVEVVGMAKSRETARQLERHWIAKLGCRKPGGLNDQPGGGIGGSAGAVEMTVVLPDGQTLHHESINDAILTRNAELRDLDQPPLTPGSVYARLTLGWLPAEALGYVEHQDGRGTRTPVTVNGRLLGSLRAASLLTGVGMATLRSRLHRRTLAGSPVDLGLVRRGADDHATRRSRPLGLRLPGSSEHLTVRTYAERIGLPKSTVLHRWHAMLRAGTDPVRLSPRALLRRLTARADRRCLVTLGLPDGRRWIGGERELIRRVVAEPGLEASRMLRLSESGIRRRLRLLTVHTRHDPALVADAFGFGLSIGERS